MFENFPYDPLSDDELLAKTDGALHELWVGRQLSLGRLTEIEARRAALADPMGSPFHDEGVVHARAKLERRLLPDPSRGTNLFDAVLKGAALPDKPARR